MVFDTKQKGTHYILVSHGWFNCGGTYDLSVFKMGQTERFLTPIPDGVSEPEGEDFPADATTPGELSVDSSVTGKLASSDIGDCFSVNLEAGTRYFITISEPDDQGVVDTYIQVHYSDMSVVFEGAGRVTVDDGLQYRLGQQNRLLL